MHICAKCHLIGSGCCFLKQDEKKFMFGLTLDEIKKIEKETGLEQYQIVKTDFVDQTFADNLRNFDEIFENTFLNDKRFRLQIENNVCRFLTEIGCKLPVDVRPYYCRLYPFWVQNGEVIIVGADKNKKKKDTDSVDECLKLMNVSKEQVYQLHKAYLESSRKHKKLMELFK